jgi:hypothetical protein
MRRRSVSRNLSWSCVVSSHFRNRGHDHIGPCISCGEMLQYLCHAPRRLHDLSKIATCLMAPSLQSHQVQISSKAAQGKGIGPTCWFVTSPEVGSGATIGTLPTGYPCTQDLKDQPHGSWSVLGAKGLWLCHVPRGTEHATHHKRAMVSLVAPWHRVRHPPGKGSGVAMCPEEPCVPPARRWL